MTNVSSVWDTGVASDPQVVDVAGLTHTDNGVIIGNGDNFVVESGATLKTSLGLTIGTNVQAYDANTAKLNVAQAWTKAQSSTPVPVTSAGNSIATDSSLSNIFTHTFTEDTTLANPTNLVTGTHYTWIFTQHASAAKTLAFGNLFVPLGTAFVVTVTLGAKATLTALYDGTSLLYTYAQA